MYMTYLALNFAIKFGGVENIVKEKSKWNANLKG